MTRSVRVLVAPDCFGDTLTAVQAAEAIAQGWQRARPADEVSLAPQSDGGPGFVAVLASRLGKPRTDIVHGPLQVEVEAQWLLNAAPSSSAPITAYLECAQACGLALLDGPPTVRTALAAHSRGVGQLIDAALQAAAERIVVGLGGSCCTDGGKAMVDELGGLPAARRRLGGIDLIAASDVEHPLLGPTGAAAVFGPQKGADPDTVVALERRLADWAVALDAAAGRAVSDEPGAGAAGGIGAALLALGGRRESGATVIAEHTGLLDEIAVADIVITGEGRFDDQSLHGKVISALARAAQRRHIPVLVLAGQVAVDDGTLDGAGVAAAHSVARYAGSVQLAIDDAAHQLAGLAQVTAARWR